MNANDKIVQNILKYINEQLDEPRRFWPDLYFKKQSYIRWACNEIIEQIMDRPFFSANDTLEDFAIKMSYFLHVSDDPDINMRFSIALEVTEMFLCYV